jgi:hypothetical protein
VPAIALYTRSGCHLCDQAQALLSRVVRRSDARVEKIDVDSDPALHAAYDVRVPVARFGDVELDWPFTEAEARRALAALLAL